MKISNKYSKYKIRKSILLLLGFLFWIQYSLFLGQNGIKDYIYLKNDILKQQNKNIKLKTRNNYLLSEIHELYYNREAIEEISRNEYDMIKPSENFYRFVQN